MSEGEQEREEVVRGDVSEKQLNFMRVLQRKVSLSDEGLVALIEEVVPDKSQPEELDRREASDVIDELQIRAKELGVDLDAQPKASEKQVGFIRSLKRRAHLTDDELARLLEDKAGVTDPTELGKRDASAVIDELLARAEGKGGGGAGGGGGDGAGGGGGGGAAAGGPRPPGGGPSRADRGDPSGPPPTDVEDEELPF